MAKVLEFLKKVFKKKEECEIVEVTTKKIEDGYGDLYFLIFK